MAFHPLAVHLLSFAVVASQAPAAHGNTSTDTVVQNPADRRFETLLAAAKNAPQSTDWNTLRHAFAQTSFYNPYNANWRQEIAKIEKDFEDGKLEAAVRRRPELWRRPETTALPTAGLKGLNHYLKPAGQTKAPDGPK